MAQAYKHRAPSENLFHYNRMCLFTHQLEQNPQSSLKRNGCSHIHGFGTICESSHSTPSFGDAS